MNNRSATCEVPRQCVECTRPAMPAAPSCSQSQHRCTFPTHDEHGLHGDEALKGGVARGVGLRTQRLLVDLRQEGSGAGGRWQGRTHGGHASGCGCAAAWPLQLPH